MNSRKSAGQSLVEFAIVVPVLLTALLMAVDFGRVYLGWINLTNVARIGANFAAANPDAWQGSGDAAVQLRYRQLMARDATGIDCTLPSTLPAPTFVDSSYAVGSRVQVNLTCTFSLLTPLISNLVGDGAGNVGVAANAVFTIRFGSPDAGVIGGNVPGPTPTSAPTPTAGPSATPSPAPGASPTPTPGATAAPSVEVSFYGSPTSADGSGGGPPGSTDENLIVGIPTLNITFHNNTTGTWGNCTWTWGDGQTSNSCSTTVTHGYTTRGTYGVSLEVDGVQASRSSYVLVGCKVPSFSGVRRNEATALWTPAGFDSDHITLIEIQGNGNYKIGYQSLVGGLVNPPGGCSGATVTVGP
ncbi:MAG: TadE/TadG family type IV pilus assembly protein [Chloroflexota bacterium]